MKPTHINDIKASNSNLQGRINANNNNNPSNQQQQSPLLQTLKTRWVIPVLLFTLGILTIFNYVPDANNYKALATMLWTSIYCVWASWMTRK